MKMRDLLNSTYHQNIVLKYGWSLVGLIVLTIVLMGAISSNRSTRELNKFVECGSSGIPCVVVQGNASGIAIPVNQDGTACDLAETGTAASGTGVTITLAASASNFHYICLLEITKFAAAALTAAATPVLVTTTNLESTPTISMNAAADAQGVIEERIYQPTHPIKSSTVNTATTIVAPATTSVIWRLNAYYYVAP